MTRHSDRLALFRDLPLFAACTSDELEEIDRLADEVHVPAGRTVLRQGDLGQEFALIVDGEADVTKDGEIVAVLRRGDYFGEVALLESITRTASVTARSDLTLQVLDRRGFNTLLDDQPRLARSMLKGLAHRLAELEASIEHLRVELARSEAS